MKRRTVLSATGGLAAALSGGCLGSLRGTDRWENADPLYPDDRSVPDGAATHDLYVENFDATAHRVDLAVGRPDDDALLLAETYDVPDERAFQVTDLLVDGRAYEFRLAVDDWDQDGFDHSVEACPESHEGGSRNAGLRIDGSTVELHEDQCDMLVVGSLPSAPHDRFVADENDWF